LRKSLQSSVVKSKSKMGLQGNHGYESKSQKQKGWGIGGEGQKQHTKSVETGGFKVSKPKFGPGEGRRDEGEGSLNLGLPCTKN